LNTIAVSGEPEAAVEIFNSHVEEVGNYAVAPHHLATYYIYRLDCLLLAARGAEKDEGKRGAYVAEAKGLMERATRSLYGLLSQSWNVEVRSTAPALGLYS
jgi:hypothetical protein